LATNYEANRRNRIPEDSTGGRLDLKSDICKKKKEKEKRQRWKKAGEGRKIRKNSKEME